MAQASTTSDVFNAIAEPRRRAIVDLLAFGAEHDVTEIVVKLGLPQPAVSKHLSVLRKVGVVAVHKDGQRRLYRLKPEELKPVHDWISNFEQFWTGHLDSIKHAAEQKAKQLAVRDRAAVTTINPRRRIMVTEEMKSLSVVKEVFIAAPPDVVFETVLEPHGPMKEMNMKLEAWPGGWFRDLGNNTGHLWGHVQVIKPPKLLELIGPTMMSYPAISHIQYCLTEQAGGTMLKFTHKAIGQIPDGLEMDVSKGWGQMLDLLRAAAEKKRAV